MFSILLIFISVIILCSIVTCGITKLKGLYRYWNLYRYGVISVLKFKLCGQFLKVLISLGLHLVSLVQKWTYRAKIELRIQFRRLLALYANCILTKILQISREIYLQTLVMAIVVKFSIGPPPVSLVIQEVTYVD